MNSEIKCYICNSNINCPCSTIDKNRPEKSRVCAIWYRDKLNYPRMFVFSDFTTKDPNWIHICSRNCKLKLPDDCIYKHICR